jgi:hypothetical protein
MKEDIIKIKMEEQNYKKDKNFFSNSSKTLQKSNIILGENQIKRSIYLNDIKIFFKKKKKEEIGLEDNNYENKKMKNLIQMLKVKINRVVFKIGISNIGCGGHHSYIYDNSFNFFNLLIFLIKN